MPGGDAFRVRGCDASCLSVTIRTLREGSSQPMVLKSQRAQTFCSEKARSVRLQPRSSLQNLSILIHLENRLFLRKVREAMLKQFSRMKRTRSWVLIIFAGLMGLSLVFFYAPNRSANVTAATSNEALAEVGSEEITVGDLAQQKEAMQQRMQMYGGQISLAQLGMTDRTMLDGLIRNRIVAQEATRLGLAPSDTEVAEALKKEFSPNGQFVGTERYKEIVLSQYGDLERFERQMRDAVAAKKLRAFITAGVQLSATEVEEEYRRQNTKIDLVYVPVAAAQLAKSINPSDAELQTYYDAHKEEFHISVPQKKIRYLFIDQAKIGEKINLSDEELRVEYDNLKPEAKQAGVKVQQIVLKVAHPDMDQQVLAKATELAQRAKGDDLNATEEEFAEIVRGNSEDPATAKNGGWLPGLVRRNPNKPNDILQNTLDVPAGQVMDPLKTGNAYYIFRRGEAVTATFEEKKKELLVSRRNSRAYGVGQGLAARAVTRLKETKDVQQVANELAAEANMSPSEMVRETPFIKPGDDVPEIGVAAQFEEVIAPLNNVNEVGERVGVRGGFAVPMLIEKRDPRTPELAEVKEQVAERVRQERAQSQLEQTARDLASQANAAGDLKAAAEKLGLTAATLDAYKLGTPLGEAGTSVAADDAIYNLKEGELTKTPIKIGDTWVVVGATKRTEADLVEFAKQRDDLSRQALTTRRDQVFGDYIAGARARYEREGEIEIYDQVLAKIEAETPPEVAPGRFPMPMPPAGG